MRLGASWAFVSGILAATPAVVAELPNGVAASEVRPTSAVVWTRTTAAGTVTFELAADPIFAVILDTAQVAAGPDFLIPQVATFSGLTPNTTYYYRATDASAAPMTKVSEIVRSTLVPSRAAIF